METTDAVETAVATEEVAPVETTEVADTGLGDVAVEAETTEAPATEGEDQEQDGVVGAPEGDYSLEGLQLPEGVSIDSELASELGNVCREMNLSQSAYAKIAERMTPAIAQRQAVRLEEVKQEFLAQGRADKEMGGGRWAQTKAEASKAYVTFVDPETRAFLKQTGLDCHPGIIRAFHKVQKAVSDDTVVRGQVSSGKPDPAKAFFYNSKMN